MENDLETMRARVARNLDGFARRTRSADGLRRAAVALVLIEDESSRPCFLLTRRSRGLKNHAGQWALPGGRVDHGETIEAAALRETHEEVGLALGPTALLGCLDDYPTRSGFVITPVIAWAGPHRDLTPNPNEVSELHRIPLADLDHPESPRLRSIPESERPVISIPLLDTHIHAPTAAILYQLREVAIAGREVRVDHFEQPVWAWR